MSSYPRTAALFSLAAVSCLLWHSTMAAAANANQPSSMSSASAINRLPLMFESNRGQSDASVRFLSRGAGFQAFFRDSSATIVVGKRASVQSSRVEISLIGSSRKVRPIAEDRLLGTTNYLLDGDAAQFVTDVESFSRIRYEPVYPGVDLIYYGTQGALEYDLVVAPHADPHKIKLGFAGVDNIRLSRDGELVLQTPSGDIAFRKPIAYQVLAGKRRAVGAEYVVAENRRSSFDSAGTTADILLL